jgi:succinate dehydrogenase hydrophobic anchor subunit
MTMNIKKSTEKWNARSPVWGQGERIGLVGWLVLYVSGLLLLFFLFAHVIAIHFVSEGNITAQSVSRDLNSGFLAVVAIGLLLLSTIHGLIGLRRVLLDLEIFGKKGDRMLLVTLTMAGIVIVIAGLEIFRRFRIIE